MLLVCAREWRGARLICDAGPRTREVIKQMLLAPQVLVLFAERPKVMPIITKDAAVRLHEVIRGRHEDSGARRRPAHTCARVTERSTAGRVNLHAIDATLDDDPAPAQDVPKRCHACSKGEGIALRNGSGLATIIFGTFFSAYMHLGRAVTDGARLARDVRGRFGLHSQVCARAVSIFYLASNLHHFTSRALLRDHSSHSSS